MHLITRYLFLLSTLYVVNQAKSMNNTVQTPSEIREALAFQLEDYCRNMNKEDLIRSFIAFLNVDQCEDVKDSLDRDIF